MKRNRYTKIEPFGVLLCLVTPMGDNRADMYVWNGLISNLQYQPYHTGGLRAYLNRSGCVTNTLRAHNVFVEFIKKNIVFPGDRGVGLPSRRRVGRQRVGGAGAALRRAARRRIARAAAAHRAVAARQATARRHRHHARYCTTYYHLAFIHIKLTFCI